MKWVNKFMRDKEFFNDNNTLRCKVKNNNDIPWWKRIIFKYLSGSRSRMIPKIPKMNREELSQRSSTTLDLLSTSSNGRERTSGLASTKKERQSKLVTTES